MKGQLKAATPAEYLKQLDEPRKSEVAALDALIRKSAPKLKPFIQMGILAYGHKVIKYASGKEVDWFRVGVASNKNYISLYIGGTESQKKALGKGICGKGCVRFKRLEDLDSAALKRLVQAVSKDPS